MSGGKEDFKSTFRNCYYLTKGPNSSCPDRSVLQFGAGFAAPALLLTDLIAARIVQSVLAALGGLPEAWLATWAQMFIALPCMSHRGRGGCILTDPLAHGDRFKRCPKNEHLSADEGLHRVLKPLELGKPKVVLFLYSDM